MLNVCIIGAGYVGGPTGIVIAAKCPSVKVNIVDTLESKINAWKSDSLPIYEPNLRETLDQVNSTQNNLEFSTNIAEKIEASDIIFLCVNTSTKMYGIGKNMACDFSCLEACCRSIMQFSTTPKIVVEKSTVPVLASKHIAYLFSTNENKLKPKNGLTNHVVLSNPEFLAEGTAIQDLCTPDRILIGGEIQTAEGKIGVEHLSLLYQNWVPKEKIIEISTCSSELAKLSANAFLAQRVSSINSISAICEKTNSDVREVARAIGADHRLGNHFLKAGIGFGGSCFPKDILHLIYLARSLNLHEVADYWEGVIKINDFQNCRFSNLIFKTMFNNLNGKKLTIFGFSFKKDTFDTRESPAIKFCAKLIGENCSVRIYDPKVSERQMRSDLSQFCSAESIDRTFSYHDNPNEAVLQSDGIVVTTDWDEFKTLNYEEFFKLMRKPAYIFDGRIILDHKQLKAIGFKVYSLGISKEII